MKTQTNSNKYEGQCKFCGQDFPKRQIAKHLDDCGQRERNSEIKNLRLRVSDSQMKNFWFIIETNEQSTLQRLDKMIRDVWVECCGHLSQFGDYGSTIGKARRIMEILTPGDKVIYLYDFGSTTELLVEALQYTNRILDKNIELVARNYLPPADCVKCDRPAEVVCTYCADEEPAMVCGECAEEYHDEDDGDHYLLPLANSPRCGVCGYEPPAPLDQLF